MLEATCAHPPGPDPVISHFVDSPVSHHWLPRKSQTKEGVVLSTNMHWPGLPSTGLIMGADAPLDLHWHPQPRVTSDKKAAALGSVTLFWVMA